MMRKLTRLALLIVAFGYFALFALPVPAEDVVILKDGTVLRGKLTREVADLNGKIDFKAYLDAIGYGPKYVFFSSHAKKQLAAIEKGLPNKDVTGYKRKIPGIGSRGLPPIGELVPVDWRENWTRTMKVKLVSGGYEMVDQMISYLGPDSMYVISTSHKWGQAYDTREFEPDLILKLLRSHPELKDPPGAIEPLRRLKIATFLKEIGWNALARREIAKLKEDVKTPWPKEVTERHDQLVTELDTADTKLAIETLEAAVGAGQYQFAVRASAGYEPKSADAKDLTRLAELRATVDSLYPQYEACKRLLRNVIDQVTGAGKQNAIGAPVGGFAVLSQPLMPLEGDTAKLVDAAAAVLNELHPDTASRLDLFRQVAEQDEKNALTAAAANRKPLETLALAVSGMLRGKNGANPDPLKALRTWNTRVMATAYLRERIGNERAGILKKYLASTDCLPHEELAQIITLLPPIDPEPLDKLNGRLLDTKTASGFSRMYSRNTGPIPEEAQGYDYYCRLPDEYHHGRSYPLVVVLTDPAMPAERALANVCQMANKYGYIAVAPKWTDGFNGTYDYTGKDHSQILAVKRDVARRFNVDPDRVYLFGVGSGATLALDMGSGHPDQFAGLTLFGPTPVYQFFQYYWTNAQKLPIFTVTGDMSGVSFDAMRKLNENWLPNGYPSLFTVYRGRGAEWFTTEVPNAFDFMNRKTRARGVASLRLNDKRFDSWKSMRNDDARFYWVGFEDKHAATEFKRPDRPDLAPLPARFSADIRAGNEIRITDVFGVKKLSIYLEKDMIDWNNDVRFVVEDGINVPPRQKLVPDLRLMFEELYRTGDRKMLFFGKFEIKTRG